MSVKNYERTSNGLSLRYETLTKSEIEESIKYIPHFPSAMSGTAAVDTSPYTSTHWDATCDEVTSLYDGMVVIIRVPVAGSDNCGVGLKINNGTYHPVVYNITKTVGARYGANSTIIAVYNANQSASLFSNSASTTSVTGVWQVYDYDSDTDTTFRLRNYSAIYFNKSGQSTNRRTLLFEVEGGLSATNKTIAISTSKVPLNFKYIPGGQIRYYSLSGAIAANSNFSASALWEQYALDIRYSFNTGSTLVEGNPVYIRMIVNSDGTLSQDASSSGDNPIVQALPSTADNKVYVYLGRAGSTTTLELEPIHPIYEYKDGAIRLWTNAVASGGGTTSVEVTGSGNAVTDASYNASTGKITLSKDTTFATSASLNNYLPLSGGSSHALTAPVYIGHSDLSFIGTKGAFGFRATDSTVTSKHLGQINLSKNFGGDGQQYGIQMSALDVTNNKYNQFRVYQNGIAYQQYDNATNTTANLFTVGTNGDTTIFGNLEIKPNVLGTTPAVTINSEGELSTAVTLFKWENTFTSGGTDTVTTVTVGAPRSINGADVSLTIPTQSGTLALKSDISDAISALPEPMVFKGSVGTNGTVTWANLPAAASTNEGHTYKVITDHTSAPICKVGDTIISNGSEWIVIPSGDEPSGTVTSVGLSVPTGLSVSGSPITSSGTLTVSYASGYSIPTTSKQSEWDNKQSALTTSSVNDGTISKVIGFDSSGNIVKATQSGGGSYTAGLGISISNGVISNNGVTYTTTAPSAANTDGDLKFVVLSSEPSTRYAGYFYIVTSGTDIALSNNEIDTLWTNN